MDNKETIKFIQGRIALIDKNYPQVEDYREALANSIKALDQVNHLTGRPCYACEFHKENGCCKWNCIFEK